MADKKTIRFPEIGAEYFIDNGDGTYSQKISSTISGTISTNAIVQNWPANPAPVSGNALASAARTATTNSTDITNTGFSAIILYLKVTAASGTGGLKIAIQNKSAAGDYYTMDSLTMTAVTAVGNVAYVYGIYSQATGGYSVQNTQQIVLGSTFRIQVQHADGSSYTYQLDYDLIP